MEWAKDQHFRAYKALGNLTLGLLKYGTIVCKVPYIVEKTSILGYNRDYSAVDVTEEVTFAGPRYVPIPIEDILVPPTAVDIQYPDSTWISHISRYSWNEVLEKKFDGDWENTDELVGQGQLRNAGIREEQEQREGIDDVFTPEWPVHEIWLRYQIKDDERPQEICATYYPPTRTILKLTGNPYLHQLRPFVKFGYMPREHRFYWIGIPEMVEDVAEGITTIHNQRIDNKTIANMMCFKVRKSSGIRPKTKLYPGKVFPVDDMGDIETFPMGQLFNSTMEDEMALKQYAERRTGVSDYTLGRESSSVGTKATATATLALIQEGNKRFDLTIRDIRGQLAECCYQALALYQQFKPEGEMYAVLGPSGAPIEQIMNFPKEFIRSRIAITINTSSASNNREISKQNDLALFGILSQYQMRLIQLVQANIQAQDPKIKAITGAMIGSLYTLFGRIIDTYEIKDTAAVNPNIMEILNGGAAQGSLAGDVSASGMGQLLGLPGLPPSQAPGALPGGGLMGAGMPPPGGGNGLPPDAGISGGIQ